MKKISLKRAAPSLQVLLWRERFLSALQSLTPGRPSQGAPIGLRPGNTKVGAHGRHYKSGFVWNLPAVATCPGASRWCRRSCYNADSRADVFPVHEWMENWAWFLHHPDQLRTQITDQLTAATAPAAVRVHSSGDFYSVPYIHFWSEIAQDHPTVRFWAYTRSWVIKELRDGLDLLRQLPNFQLFASVDHTMVSPLQDWRLAIVVDAIAGVKKTPASFLCPEQIGRLSNCLSCGYCIVGEQGNVVFTLH